MHYAWNIAIRRPMHAQARVENDAHDAGLTCKATTLAMKIAMRHRSTVKLASCFLIAIVIAMLCLGPVGALSSRQQKVLNNLKIRAQETGQVTSMKEASILSAGNVHFTTLKCPPVYVRKR